MKTLNSHSGIFLCLLTLATACTSAENINLSAVVPELYPGILAGYLSPKELPNSLSLIPKPPAPGSAALALDQETSRNGLALRGTARWDLASLDARYLFPQAGEAFTCALNAPITEKDTPHTYRLLRRSFSDFAIATYAAKQHYVRTRPFLENKQPTCSPNDEKILAKDGSYPSGHAAFGWGWALILAEIAPAQADAILARGQAFGQSRVICNVHWQSDVIQGRSVGAAAVARLHGNATFHADLAAAKSEIAAAHSKTLKPTRDCAVEAAALAQE